MNHLHRLLAASAVILAVFAGKASAQNMKTSGTVLDEGGLPLPGVAVMATGTSTGTVTDLDGLFELAMPDGVTSITVSCIGYVSQTLTAAEGMTISLVPDSTLLEEIVVIGYGTQKKTDLTGSISSVSEKDFNQGLISSPEQLVNGKVAGVQIMSAGGSPTSGSTIRIRGGASLNASNDPLIVLDGVPMEVGGSVSGSGNFLSLINPADIESMTVLKDASSTAIYGSRASNGVILITTKKGSNSGKPKVSFTSTTSLQTPYETVAMMSREDFIKAINRYGTDAQKALIDESVTTDWNKVVWQNALGTDDNISLSGNLKGQPYRVSLGIYDQDGILKSDNSRRYTLGLSTSPSFMGGALKTSFGLKGTVSRNRFANQNAIWGATTGNPTSPVYSDNADSFLGYYEAIDDDGGTVNGAVANPLGQIENYKSTSTVFRVIANADADYTVQAVDGLRLHATLGYDYSNGRGNVYVPAEAYSYYTTGGRDYSYGPQQNHNRLITLYANYNREFGKHKVDATLGYDWQYWIYENAAYSEYNVAKELQSSSAASDERHVLLSGYARVNYSYDSRYLLTATLRCDGSSRFSKSNRWGAFPSVAFAWHASQEEFMSDVKDTMNDLKLRLSYGVTGQQDGIANYSYMSTYTASQAKAFYSLGGTPIMTYRPSSYNPDLKWETTTAFNVGADAAFLNDRFSASIDWYTRKTRDLLATVAVPAGSNFDKQLLSNIGNIASQGLEMSFNANIISTRDFSWHVSGNATWQTAKITNLKKAGAEKAPDTLVGAVDSYYVQVLSEGFAPYSYYVYQQVYDEETGMPLEGVYVDRNGDGEITSADRYHYHSAAPDWMLGLSTSLTWKNWSLSASLRSNIGGYLYNGMAMNTGAWETVSYNDKQLNLLHSSWEATNFQKRQYESDYYVENASFLKLDNITLGYNFGEVGPLRGLNISAMVQNVATFTKYGGLDPECSSGIDMTIYPRPRIYSLTLGINF